MFKEELFVWSGYFFHRVLSLERYGGKSQIILGLYGCAHEAVQYMYKHAYCLSHHLTYSCLRTLNSWSKTYLTINKKLKMVLQNIWRRVVGIVLMNIFISIVFLTTSGWKISSQLFTAICSLMGQCKIFIGWQSQFVGNFLISISQSNVFLTKNACKISSKLSKHLAKD